MRRHGLPIELVTLLYALAYLPYVMLTRYLSTGNVTDAGSKALTGLEILPVMMISGAVFTFAFIWLAGWGRNLTRVQMAGISVPFASRWTMASGLCTALVLTAVPLSYTFQDVSIPFMQLLMRGDILIIAPLVDILCKRKVHWWSWAALALVAIGLAITLGARGGLKLPPLAIATILVYTAGYFGRLWIMSKISKDDDIKKMRRFFSEEKIVGFPMALLLLLAIPLFSTGNQAEQIIFGFTEIWHRSYILPIAFCGLMVCFTGVCSSLILLDGRENSYCVPLERSASILAGIAGSVALALFFGGSMPSMSEFTGASLLVGAVSLLSIGPRVSRRNAVTIEQHGYKIAEASAKWHSLDRK